MIRLHVVTALCALALAATPNPGGAAEPYQIDVIVNLTGQAALAGKQSADSLRLIEAQVNRTGGIRGRPLQFVFHDDQTNPATSVSLANAIIAKNVPVIMGPTTAANCNAVFPLVQNGPVMWCFSPGFHPPKGSYGFSSNSASGALITDTVRFFHALGLDRIAFIVSTDATGLDGERMLDAAAAMPEMAGLSLVAREHFKVDDISVAAQMARIKAANPQALIVWTTLTPFATVLRGYTEAGMDIPVATVNANGSAAQLRTYTGFMPKALYIAAQLNQVPDQIPPGPLKRKIDAFYSAYRTTLGYAPEGNANLSWDAAQIIVDALRANGPAATAQQIRDYIENLHGWIGINGEYDFRDGSQRGLGERNAVMMRWDPVKTSFFAVSKPGGLPLK